MSIIDDIAKTSTETIMPPEYRQHQEWTGDAGSIATGLRKPVENFEELLKEFGYDPEKVEIIGSVNQWRKQQPDGTYLVSYFFKVKSREHVLDVPSLYASARRRAKAKVAGERSARTTVVCLSDIQAGKTSHRGGTPELLERLSAVRSRLAAELKRRRPDALVLAEGGDLFEGFESGGNPMFTNDLSLAQQMDVAGTEIYEFIDIMQKHGHVDVMAVTSNHTAWRRGKQELGDPHDDLGLHVHRTVEKLAQAKGLDASWHYPGPYSEQSFLSVRGNGLGLVHGNQFSPGGAVKWWQGQQHGGQPVGAADILLTGHYHYLSLMPTGRNPATGKSKWHIQMPTLDNGSTWFRNISGDDSDPGLLVFDITDDGFDLQSLTVL